MIGYHVRVTTYIPPKNSLDETPPFLIIPVSQISNLNAFSSIRVILPWIAFLVRAIMGRKHSVRHCSLQEFWHLECIEWPT